MSYDAVVSVIEEARTLIHRSVAAVDRLHADLGVTAPMRAVLEFLDRAGPTTVSDIARDRGVSRQHIQTIVNDLADRELVDRLDNPRHQRAPLIALSPSGVATIEGILAAERAAFAGPLAHLADDRLAVAAEVLREIRTVMQQHVEESS